jgi:hypothetical protein
LVSIARLTMPCDARNSAQGAMSERWAVKPGTITIAAYGGIVPVG